MSDPEVNCNCDPVCDGTYCDPTCDPNCHDPANSCGDTGCTGCVDCDTVNPCTNCADPLCGGCDPNNEPTCGDSNCGACNDGACNNDACNDGPGPCPGPGPDYYGQGPPGPQGPQGPQGMPGQQGPVLQSESRLKECRLSWFGSVRVALEENQMPKVVSTQRGRQPLRPRPLSEPRVFVKDGVWPRQ